jgi:tetratricopeptide (TPR) repeat protein
MRHHNINPWLLLLLAGVLALGAGCTRSAKASRHLNRAEKYFAADDYEKAEIEYINVLRLQSTNQTAIRHLAEIFYADEMLPNALALLNRARQTDPNDLDVRAKRARLFLGGGAMKEAREEADFVLQHSPTNEEALLVIIDASARPEEIVAAARRVAALRQQTGDKPLFHVANGYLAMRQTNVAGAEAEFKAAVAMDNQSGLAHWALANFYLSRVNFALAESESKAAAELSPLRSPRRLRYASLRARAGDFTAANAIVTNITSKAPDYIPAWIYSARLAVNQTNLVKATSDLDRVLRRVPNHYEGLSTRAEVYMMQNKPDKALADVDRLVAAYPKSAPARYQFAVVALANKDAERALTSLKQAVALDRTLTPAVLLLAELNLGNGDTSAAIAALTETVKREPANQRAQLMLARAFRAAGRLTDAVAQLGHIVKAFPKNNGEALFMMGDLFRQQGNLADARKIFEAILVEHPDAVSANSQIVAIDVAARDYDKAAQRVQQWIARAPNDPEPVFQMAKILYAQNDVKGAQALLEKVVAMNPDAIPAYSMLARIYYDTHQVDAALEKSKAALVRSPNDPASLIGCAIIYDEKHDYQNARDYYEKVLAVAPNNIVALNNLAVIYSERLNDLEKAYAVARKAQEARPLDPSISDTFGWILARRGDYFSALTYLAKAAQANPTEPEIAGHLGITQYMLGDETSARASLDRALKLAPAFAGRDQVEKSIALLNIDPTNADAAAVSTLEKRLQETPADTVALSRLASIYERAGKSDKAAAIYEKAVTANPKLAIAAARLAEITDQRQPNSARALELARNARKLDAEDPRIAHIAGRIASKSSDAKDEEWGLSLLQESNQKQSGDATVAYDLGWAYLTLGRLAEAENAMKSALAAGPNLPNAAAAKRVLEFLPLIDPARAAQQQAVIDQALQADANYLPALAARAAAAQQKGDTAAALKTLDQIFARYPGFAPAVRSYAILSASQAGDATKALAIANRARELFPDDPLVDRARGILQYRKGDYANANLTLKSVAAKRPDDETVQYYLGLSHYQLKQPTESKVALKKAIQLQPKAPFAADVQRILSELK